MTLQVDNIGIAVMEQRVSHFHDRHEETSNTCLTLVVTAVIRLPFYFLQRYESQTASKRCYAVIQ